MEQEVQLRQLSRDDDLDSAALSLALTGASWEKPDRIPDEHLGTTQRENNVHHRDLRANHNCEPLDSHWVSFLRRATFYEHRVANSGKRRAR
jgi:hypothetical protein